MYLIINMAVANISNITIIEHFRAWMYSVAWTSIRLLRGAGAVEALLRGEAGRP